MLKCRKPRTRLLGDAGHATAAPLTRVSFPTPTSAARFDLPVLRRPSSLAVVGRSPPGTRSHRDRFYMPSLHRPVSWHVTRHPPPPDTPRRRGLATSFAGINPLHFLAGVNCDCVTKCRGLTQTLVSFLRSLPIEERRENRLSCDLIY